MKFTVPIATGAVTQPKSASTYTQNYAATDVAKDMAEDATEVEAGAAITANVANNVETAEIGKVEMPAMKEESILCSFLRSPEPRTPHHLVRNHSPCAIT